MQERWLLSDDQYYVFLGYLSYNQDFLESIRQTLINNEIPDEAYEFYVKALIDFYDTFGRLPSKLEIQTDLRGRVEAADLEDYEISKLNRLLKTIFSSGYRRQVKQTSYDLEAYVRTIASIILKKAQTQFAIEELSDFQRTGEGELPLLFENFQSKSEEINLVGEAPKVNLTFKDGWDLENPMVVKTSGLAMFDRYMDGVAKNEIYLFFAPYGVCKTTVAVQLWAESAKMSLQEELSYHERAALLEPDEEVPEFEREISVFISFEPPTSPELHHRLLMCAAKISRDSLKRMGTMGLAGLSDEIDNPKVYEQDIFSEEIATGLFIPERQRAVEVIEWINTYTLVLDFSGSNMTHANAGTGGVPEIVACINAELRSREKETGVKHRVRNVMLDYLGAMLERVYGEKASENAVLTQVMVKRLVDGVSKKYGCHIWVMQQLSGLANAQLNPTAKLHHTMGKGCKSVGENADFCFVVGHLEPVNQIGQLVCTKARRAKMQKSVLVKVEGEYNTVRMASGYGVDATGSIALVSETAGSDSPFSTEVESI